MADFGSGRFGWDEWEVESVGSCLGSEGTEIVCEDEWGEIYGLRREVVIRGELMELRGMASKWMVFLKEDLCLSEEEMGIVIGLQGLHGVSGLSDIEMDYVWGQRLRCLREFIWVERGCFVRFIRGNRGVFELGDRWTWRCTAVVNMLLMGEWVDEFSDLQMGRYYGIFR
jgi:hypothetical protein